MSLPDMGSSDSEETDKLISARYESSIAGAGGGGAVKLKMSLLSPAVEGGGVTPEKMLVLINNKGSIASDASPEGVGDVLDLDDAYGSGSYGLCAGAAAADLKEEAASRGAVELNA